MMGKDGEAYPMCVCVCVYAHMCVGKCACPCM